MTRRLGTKKKSRMRHSIASVGVETERGLFAFISGKTDLIVRNLETYKELNYPELDSKTDPDIFKQRSYEIACIDQLKSLVRLNPEMSLCDICFELMDEIGLSYESLDIPVEIHEIVSVFMDVLRDILFLTTVLDVRFDEEIN